jgi:hypothetical protein
MIRLTAITATVLLTAAGDAFACDPAPIGKDAARLAGRDFVLFWRAEPAPLRLGDFFAVTVSACNRGSQRVSMLKVDATMPAHKHGMNYLPTILAEGGGRFLARGLLLHMPGRWEFAFDVATDDTRETLRTNVDLK